MPNIPSLLYWPTYKSHTILVSILVYKKCNLYVTIYGIHNFIMNLSDINERDIYFAEFYRNIQGTY